MAETKRYRNIVFDSERWEGFAFRDDDIVISTPAKCGTTWTQMLCALLIFDTTDLPGPLAHLSPWLDMQTRALADVVAELEAQTHRRFIKTHTPLDGLPRDERVTYIGVGRDPRDVSLSWDHHLSNLDFGAFIAIRAAAVGLDDLAEMGPPSVPSGADPRARFWEWAEEDDPTTGFTLAGMLHHLQGFWDSRNEANIALFHYSDFHADLVGQMERLARVLGVERTRERIEVLAEAAQFERMKSAAEQVAPNSDQGLWKSTSEFFHKGSSGQWRDVLDEDDLARYEKRVAELVPPDLAGWAHKGWLGQDGGR